MGLMPMWLKPDLSRTRVALFFLAISVTVTEIFSNITLRKFWMRCWRERWVLPRKD